MGLRDIERPVLIARPGVDMASGYLDEHDLGVVRPVLEPALQVVLSKRALSIVVVLDLLRSSVLDRTHDS